MPTVSPPPERALATMALAPLGIQSLWSRTGVGWVHRLELEGRGDLPPIVLLHGLASAAVHLMPLMLTLRPHTRRVVAFDLPGHGWSERPAAHETEALRAATATAIDSAMREPSLVVGNSLGGAMALSYALVRPLSVAGLVLCSPSGAQSSESALRELIQTFRISGHGDALAFMDRVTARPSPLRHLFAWGLRRQLQNPTVQSLLSSITAGDLFRPEEISALEVPTLLLWGKQERILPPEDLAFFREHLPEAAVIEEPHGMGHAPYLDDRRALAERIVSFARDVSASHSAEGAATIRTGVRRPKSDASELRPGRRRAA